MRVVIHLERAGFQRFTQACLSYAECSPSSQRSCKGKKNVLYRKRFIENFKRV